MQPRLALLPRSLRRPHPVHRLHDAGSRLAGLAWRHWFLDRQAQFWLRELGSSWSVTERRARVVDVIDETWDTRTLVLAPGRWWPGHRAGQYVPVEIEVDGVRVRRCYSISSGSSEPRDRRIAITIRRVAGGRVSTALHQLRRGATVGLGLPAGDFVLDAPDLPKLLLVAGGSGVTPIMAFVRDLTAHPAARRNVVVIHGARGADDAIFGHQLASLATRFPWLTLHARRDDDPTAGRLDQAALRALVPDLADREIFVCGPPGLMDTVSDAASAAGAARPVHLERFVAPAPRTSDATAPVAIDLVRSGLRVTISGPGPLLAQLERAGQRPAFGCRIGICQTCRCRKQRGTTEDCLTGAISSEPDQEIRLCVSIARSDLELAL